MHSNSFARADRDRLQNLLIAYPSRGTAFAGLVNTLLSVLFAFVILVSASYAQSGLTITAGAVATAHDTIPRFCNLSDPASPVVASVAPGGWSDPTIWENNAVPGLDARVRISANTQVTYDVVASYPLKCIEVSNQGHLLFDRLSNTRLILDELMVMPGGTLTVGTEQNPVSDSVTAEVIFRGDTPLKTGTILSPGFDPRQYGKGLIILGKIEVHGRKLERTFIRFAIEPNQSDQVLALDSVPLGWHPGDRLIIPDTRQIPFTANRTFVSQGEEVTVDSVSGQNLGISTTLQHNHHGPRNVHNQVGLREALLLPHVGNLTRNVIFRSQNPDQILRRGHAIFLHRAEVDLRYAMFKDLGRTSIAGLDNAKFGSSGQLQSIGSNQVGRYSIHLHHLWGPINPANTGYQYKVVGNVMHGMKKWGLTIHDTHYGLIKDNIAYAGSGSAIATEEGNESYNVIERNLVVHTAAGDTQPILSTNVGRGGVFNSRALFGTTRDAFWFSGPYNYVRDNVAANVPDFAYNYNGYYIKDTMRVPRFRGANIQDPNEYEGWNYHGSGSQFVVGRDRREGLPVLESTRNEAYGATGQGLWLTWSRGCCSVSYYKQVSRFKDFHLWHINHTGVYAFHESRNSYEGFIMRDDPGVSILSGPNGRFNRGFWLGTSSYENGQLLIRNFDIQGFNIGIALPPNPQDGTNEPNFTLVENGVLKNHINLREFLVAGVTDKTTTVRNVEFTPVDIYQSNRLPPDPVNIEMSGSVDSNIRPMRRAEMMIEKFNGDPNNNFRLYWREQAANELVIPYARPELNLDDPDIVCSLNGLTNAQCMNQFNKAVAGAVAPCLLQDGDNCEAARSRAEVAKIVGLLFSADASPVETKDICFPIKSLTGKLVRICL